MKDLVRSLGALPMLAIALGASAPIYAATIVEGQVGQNLGGVATNLYSSGAQNGSAVSDNITWSFTCTTCSGYGVSANGAATINNGSLGTSSSVTVTGTPTAPHYVLADSSAVFNDTLTMTNGTGSGVLELTYALDGSISSTGTGFNGSTLDLYSSANNFQFDNQGIQSGSFVEVSGNGTYNDTVTFYYAFTYGTALSTLAYLDAGAMLNPPDSTPYTATVNYYNTAALTSALVFGGTVSNLGTANNAAVISSATGLNYGPSGISAAPEPSSWFLLASGIGLVALAKRTSLLRLHSPA